MGHVHFHRHFLQLEWKSPEVKYQAGEADISIREMLAFTVSNSDNNGCDLLFKLVGGTKKVNDYIHSLGIKDIAMGHHYPSERAASYRRRFCERCQGR